jgi:hypothetical protein
MAEIIAPSPAEARQQSKQPSSVDSKVTPFSQGEKGKTIVFTLSLWERGE